MGRQPGRVLGNHFVSQFVLMIAYHTDKVGLRLENGACAVAFKRLLSPGWLSA